MPNANPFQHGIGGRRESIDEENQPGSSTFFTAQSEEEATSVLEAIHPDPDKAAARYIISDADMATGKFYAMTAWTLDIEGYYQPYWIGNEYRNLPSTRYYNSMDQGCIFWMETVLSSTVWFMRPGHIRPRKPGTNRFIIFFMETVSLKLIRAMSKYSNTLRVQELRELLPLTRQLI